MSHGGGGGGGSEKCRVLFECPINTGEGGKGGMMLLS